jgi:hypothetical protein
MNYKCSTVHISTEKPREKKILLKLIRRTGKNIWNFPESKLNFLKSKKILASLNCVKLLTIIPEKQKKLYQGPAVPSTLPHPCFLSNQAPYFSI